MNTVLIQSKPQTTENRSLSTDDGTLLPKRHKDPRSIVDGNNDTRRLGTADPFEPKGKVTPLVRLTPPTDFSARRFNVIQQWEGVITDISGDSVWADIEDLSNPENPPEIIELPLAEIPEADRELVGEGGVFYWIIGYETSPGGTIRRVSEIRMRRQPRWSRRAITSIMQSAESRYRCLNANGPGQTAGS